jgi:hypothetical protein
MVWCFLKVVKAKLSVDQCIRSRAFLLQAR